MILCYKLYCQSVLHDNCIYLILFCFSFFHNIGADISEMSEQEFANVYKKVCLLFLCAYDMFIYIFFCLCIRCVQYIPFTSF